MDRVTDVAFYLPSLEGGGAERAVLALANAFSKKGLRVDLVLASATGPYLSELRSDVRLIDLKAGRVTTSLPGLVRYLRRQKPAAMLSALNHANVVAILAKFIARVPTRLVVSERNSPAYFAAGNLSWRRKLVRPMMRWAYRHADAVVAVSVGVADDLASIINLPRENISVIYNPVVTPELYTRAAEPLAHPWLEPNEPPVILGVGRLTAQKDFATLIRAFAEVRSQRACRLVILGEGELRPQLEALVDSLGLKDCVELPGFCENPFAWMSRVAVFVLSSTYEGLPNVLIQAMACGAPVVSTDCRSGPSEILEGGRWGKIVPVGDIDEMAAAIELTLSRGDLTSSVERAKFFGEAQAVEGYASILRSQSGTAL